jgi:hypothetical protein
VGVCAVALLVGVAFCIFGACTHPYKLVNAHRLSLYACRLIHNGSAVWQYHNIHHLRQGNIVRAEVGERGCGRGRRCALFTSLLSERLFYRHPIRPDHYVGRVCRPVLDGLCVGDAYRLHWRVCN